MNSVRLISVSKPIVKEVQTSDQLLAFFARVSNSANQLDHSTGPRLIRYLIRNKEWSPLEMVSATVEITTTRDISRQILRHRSFSFQEWSQRYAETAPALPRETRRQDLVDRQNSLPLDSTSAVDEDLDNWWRQQQQEVGLRAFDAYNAALSQGVAKEVARAILPEGLTQTRLYMAGTLRSWLHYTALRTQPSTQKEHREIAFACWQTIHEHFRSVPEFKDA